MMLINFLAEDRLPITIENPPGFVVRTEAQKAAFDNGYRIDGSAAGWMRYGSTTARGDIWLSRSLKQWTLVFVAPTSRECG